MLFVIGFILFFIPITLLFPTKIIHKENLPKRKTKAIVTSNHYSNWDTVVYAIRLKRKFRFLAKQELFKNKFVGLILKNLGGIPIDREKLTPAAFKETMKQLKLNRQLFIYPEGTRNKSGSKQLLEIKSGIITFASKGGVDITPMLLYQKPKVFRKNYIIIGKPFKLEGENISRLSKEETDANLERYLKCMRELREELEEYVARKKKR